MEIELHKWSGAGNLFVIADGRGADVEELRIQDAISRICRRYGTDGLMILNDPKLPGTAFDMEFYNPDGSGGMMCGNGGRCIVAFADMIGCGVGAAPRGVRPDGLTPPPAAAGGPPAIEPRVLRPRGAAPTPHCYIFTAPDGLHDAEILSRPADPSSPAAGERWTVRLRMIDAFVPRALLGGWFINPGTRHFVKFVPDVEALDIEAEAKPLRWHPEFAPEGTNVNFVQPLADGSLKVRTFEKGVEGETAACGTGITASALVAYQAGLAPVRQTASAPVLSAPDQASVHLALHARTDSLSVDFVPGAESFTSVYLTGPAELLR